MWCSIGQNPYLLCPKCGAKVDKALIQEQEHRRLRTLPLDGNTLKMLEDFIGRGGPVSQKDSMFIFGINRHRAWQRLLGIAPGGLAWAGW